jgi:hypothetical protein
MTKGKKYKQRSTKHTYKTKDRVTRTPLKTTGELRCSGQILITPFGIFKVFLKKHYMIILTQDPSF